MKTAAILALVSVAVAMPAAGEGETVQFNQQNKQFSVAPAAIEGKTVN